MFAASGASWNRLPIAPGMIKRGGPSRPALIRTSAGGRGISISVASRARAMLAMVADLKAQLQAVRGQ